MTLTLHIGCLFLAAICFFLAMIGIRQDITMPLGLFFLTVSFMLVGAGR